MNKRLHESLLWSTAVALPVTIYSIFLRELCLTWGATTAEVERPMPGDDRLLDARPVTTRAVTIRADVSAVWPWLVQMGPGRAGAYTYDWIENLLGLNMHSADEIRPEWQHLSVGDTFPMGDGPALRVEILEPESALVLGSVDGQWIWAFGLYPTSDGATRLISRNRIAVRRSPLARLLFRFVMEPGSLVMERKMLLGIKQRAERIADRPPAPPDTRVAAEQ